MSYRRKRENGIYHIEYTDPRTGKKCSRSTKTRSNKVASRIQKELDNKLAMIDAGLESEIVNTRRLSDLVARYAEFCFAQKAESTAKRDMDAQARFRSFAGNIQLIHITKDLIEQYRMERLQNVSPGTVNLEIRHLKAAFNIAKSWGMIHDNPFVGVKMLKIPQKDVPRFLEIEDIGRLRTEMKDSPLRSIIEYYLLTGCRLQEGTLLVGDDIDFRRGLIHIRGEKTKSKRNRFLPFKQLPGLEDLLRQQESKPDLPVFGSMKDPNKQLHPATVTHHVRRIFDSIGMPWAHTHTFRHTFASHLIMSGVEMWTVSKLLGHSSIAVTEKHYAHLAPRHAEEAMSKLPY